MKLKTLLGLFVLSVVGIEILVLTFYNRDVQTLCLVLIGLWSLNGKSLSIWKPLLWLGSVATLCIFLNVPVIGKMADPIFG